MPGVGSGVDSQFGLAEEAFYGTVVTPDRFVEFLTASINVDVRKIQAMQIGRGLAARHDRTKTYIAGAAGPVTYYVTNKAFGKIFKLMLGTHVITWPGATNASQVLTFTGQPLNTETVTIGSTVYTFQTTLTDVAGNVLIGATVADSIRNLAAAINLDAGEGNYYAQLTTIHPTVSAVAAATTLTITDKTASGTTANAVATTETLTNGSWGAVTMAGGVNGTDTERKHTFTPSTRGLYRRSGTVQMAIPDTGGIERPFTFEGGKVVGWKLSLATDGWLTLELTWDFETGQIVTSLATATYASSAFVYDFTQFVLTVGGTTLSIRSFEVSGAWAMATGRRFIGNVKLEPRANGEWVITGTMDAEFSDLTAFNAFIAGTQAALVLTGTGITIPSSANPFKFVLTLPVIEYTGSTPNVPGPDIIRQALPFKAYKNNSDAHIQIDYHTSDVAA